MIRAFLLTRKWRVTTQALAVCALIAIPVVAAGQSDSGFGDREESSPHPNVRHARAPRIYLGMWTSHLKEDRRHGLSNNWAVGAAVKGYFGATFLNSYGGRSVTAGIQRTVMATAPGRVNVFVGYRLGILTGYDGRLMPLAARTPVLPLIQPFVSVDIGHAGVEVSYTFVVISVATSYKF